MEAVGCSEVRAETPRVTALGLRQQIARDDSTYICGLADRELAPLGAGAARFPLGHSGRVEAVALGLDGEISPSVQRSVVAWRGIHVCLMERSPQGTAVLLLGDIHVFVIRIGWACVDGVVFSSFRVAFKFMHLQSCAALVVYTWCDCTTSVDEVRHVITCPRFAPSA